MFWCLTFIVENLSPFPRGLRQFENGPLATHIQDIARRLSEQRYSTGTIRGKIQLLANLSDWLKQRHLKVEALNSRRIERFIADRARRGRGVHGARGSLRAFRASLQEAGVSFEPDASETRALDRIELGFRNYISETRGLSDAAVVNYLPAVRKFVAHRFGDGPIRLDRLSTRDASRFMLRIASHMKPNSVKVIGNGLRAFFRYLRFNGVINADLAASVPLVAGWRLSNVPRHLGPEEVARLIRTCDRGTPMGRRDYAILLLLSRLGLRAREVVRLSLEDIDWQAGELIIHGKGRTTQRMPLVPDVGQALVQYLRTRPACETRAVFLRMMAPYRGFRDYKCISSIVRRSVLHSGISPLPATKGAHLLRHSLATGLLARGASLHQISLALRHRTEQSTEVYAKVDLKALRPLGQPWPERRP